MAPPSLLTPGERGPKIVGQLTLGFRLVKKPSVGYLRAAQQSNAHVMEELRAVRKAAQE